MNHNNLKTNEITINNGEILKRIYGHRNKIENNYEIKKALKIIIR